MVSFLLHLAINPSTQNTNKKTPSPNAKISASSDTSTANNKKSAWMNSCPALKHVAKTACWRRSGRKRIRIVLLLPLRPRLEVWKKYLSQICLGVTIGDLTW